MQLLSSVAESASLIESDSLDDADFVDDYFSQQVRAFDSTEINLSKAWLALIVCARMYRKIATQSKEGTKHPAVFTCHALLMIQITAQDGMSSTVGTVGTMGGLSGAF